MTGHREKRYCPFCGDGLTRRMWEGRRRLYCETCDDALYENPVPASCLVVVDDLDRVLLVKRNVPPRQGWWCLPGGFIELGETPEEGALRELIEETGLRGEIDRLLGVVTTPNRQYQNVLMIGYVVIRFTGDPMPGDDADAVEWFPRDRLPPIAFTSHERFIADYYETYSLTN